MHVIPNTCDVHVAYNSPILYSYYNYKHYVECFTSTASLIFFYISWQLYTQLSFKREVCNMYIFSFSCTLKISIPILLISTKSSPVKFLTPTYIQDFIIWWSNIWCMTHVGCHDDHHHAWKIENVQNSL